MQKILKWSPYEKAVFDLLCWRNGQDFFTCQLYSLMQKADKSNFQRLHSAFPIEGTAFLDWQKSDDPGKFFQNIFGA